MIFTEIPKINCSVLAQELCYGQVDNLLNVILGRTDHINGERNVGRNGLL